MSFYFNKLSSFLILSLLFSYSCGTPYQPEEEPEEQEEKPIDPIDSVSADGTLETVTWNLLGYGTGFTGPSNQEQQTKNIIQVLDSLNADLYAFQEVYQQQSLNNILDHMEGYRGFTAEYINQQQQMAFVYNTNTIDSLSAGPIQNIEGISNSEWSYYWANGRLPLYFSFKYTYENTPLEFYAIVIHGISNYGDDKDEDYERRKKAAEGLYHYLQNEKPDAKIILLGDYNDDVDVSIYDDSSKSSYYPFVDDSENFNVLTKKLSDSGESASVNYDDIIDHITISDEIFDLHIEGSTAVYDEPESYIDFYGSTTSDHYPVWAKFDVTKSENLAINELEKH